MKSKITKQENQNLYNLIVENGEQVEFEIEGSNDYESPCTEIIYVNKDNAPDNPEVWGHWRQYGNHNV